VIVARVAVPQGHWIEPALDKYGGAAKLKAIKGAVDDFAARRRSYWRHLEGA
jgi:hypothetical protein